MSGPKPKRSHVGCTCDECYAQAWRDIAERLKQKAAEQQQRQHGSGAQIRPLRAAK